MNKAYRVIFSNAKNCWVVVREDQRAEGKSKSVKIGATGIVSAVLCAPLLAHAAIVCVSDGGNAGYTSNGTAVGGCATGGAVAPEVAAAGLNPANIFVDLVAGVGSNQSSYIIGPGR